MLEKLIDYYPFLGFELLGNNLAEWIKALVIFATVFMALKLFQSVAIKKMQKVFTKTKTQIDDIVINAIDAIYWPFYAFAAVYITMQFINVSNFIEKWTSNIFLVIVIYYAIKFLSEIIDFGAKSIIQKKEEDPQDTGIIKILSGVAKILLWVGAAVLVLANLGYDVTSLIAGLGVGGIAIALALQNILGDLFSSLAIYFDKPFRIGDFIVLGDKMGTVKRIGIKTTRIQAPQGEEIVVANSELTKAQIQNFGVMEKRRNLYFIGVTYDTPAEKLKNIPGMIKEIIEKYENVEFSRVHFKSFADSSLLFEVVYFVLTGDYNEFMDMQEKINLDIAVKFQKENIEFAFPSQTVYLKKD